MNQVADVEVKVREIEEGLKYDGSLTFRVERLRPVQGEVTLVPVEVQTPFEVDFGPKSLHHEDNEYTYRGMERKRATLFRNNPQYILENLLKV